LRAKRLIISTLLCLGRHTGTGLITTAGRQFIDWSADYKLFSQGRFDKSFLFDVIRKGIIEGLPEDAPFIAAMDDTVIKKTGTKIEGVTYRRDPMSPPFHTNFIRGQRYIQVSAALPPEMTEAPHRMIPVDFVHAPTAKKPGRKASPEKHDQYLLDKKRYNLSRQGMEAVKSLREALDKDEGCGKRKLWLLVDGSYTNKNVFRNIPANTTVIGRTRKDTKLYFPYVDDKGGKGRKRSYGDRAPTPEELRKDESTKWEKINVYAAGKMHEMKIKTLGPVLWRAAGYDKPLLLIVIKPLTYRPRKGSRLLYRRPAYLLCSDPDMSPAEAVKAYVWRWDIELNIRDEKQIIGVGEAQVRTKSSVESFPALSVAAYGMLLLSAAKVFGVNGRAGDLPEPAWRKNEKKKRASTQDLIRLLRNEVWGRCISSFNFSGFMTRGRRNTKPKKLEMPLHSAVLYAIK